METESEVDSDIFEGTPPDLKRVAEEAANKILPSKSKELYEAEYKNFKEYCTKQKVGKISENVLLSYFVRLLEKYAISSVWPKYSFLKLTLMINDNIDISGYEKLKSFLKRTSETHTAKKATVLTNEQIKQFLQNAPDSEYLDVKVVTIFAIMGALRPEEIIKIKTNDVEDLQKLYFVKIPHTKTKMPKSFTIHDNYYDIVKYYCSLRPASVTHTRFFINYQRQKCTVQPIGNNKVSNMPRQIAKYLNLPNVQSYTGHSFQRSSASIVANAGADSTTLKRHGNWKSLKVAESYVEELLHSKNKIANLIESQINSPPLAKKSKFTFKKPILCNRPEFSHNIINYVSEENVEESEDVLSIPQYVEEDELNENLSQYIHEEIINVSQTSEICMSNSTNINSNSASSTSTSNHKPNIHLHNCHNITFNF